MRLLVLTALVPALLIAQETPTEREAAREVLKKMDALKKSLDVPGWVSRLSAPNAERDAVTDRAKKLMDSELLAMCDDITKYPEIGFEEKRSIHLFNNIDAARTTMRPEARIQGVITEGGAAPNVVPDRTAADFYIRYPDAVYLAQVREAVDNAAHVAEAPRKPQGYEETGSVSSAIPGLGFTAYTSNAANHTYEMEADALTEVGHQGFVVDAQAMAALLFDFAACGLPRRGEARIRRHSSALRRIPGGFEEGLHRAARARPAVTYDSRMTPI